MSAGRDFVAEGEALAGALRTLGLDVQSVVGHRITRRHENWRVALGDGSRRLLRIPHQGDTSLQREQAALRKLGACELPHVRAYERIDAVVGRPAALSDWLEGADGLGAMDAHPELLPRLCQLMGSTRRTLEQQTTGRCAAQVSGGRYFSGRAFWAGEYRSLVHDWYETSRRGGLSMGPVGELAMRRLAKASPVLAEVERACLVHGDLRPVNFLLQLEKATEKNQPPTAELVGVVDWEFAVMGDPLLAWALPLELPDDALYHVVEGYGREAVMAWLSDQKALARLDVYAVGRVFQYLAEVVRLQLEYQQHWGHGLTHATRLLTERMRPGFAERKLRRVLEMEPPESVAVPDWEVPQRALAWRALVRLSFAPLLEPEQLMSWMAAVACALRHEAFPDEGWAAEGSRHLADLPQGQPRSFEPIGDRRAWLAGLERHIAARSTDRALVVLWLGYQGFGFLAKGAAPNAWMVSDDTLRGLQTVVELSGHLPVPTEPREVLQVSALAYAAEAKLAALLDRPVDAQRQRARLAHIREAWEDLTLFQGHTPVDEPSPNLGTWVVPVALLAVDSLRDLPMKPGELIHAITA